MGGTLSVVALVALGQVGTITLDINSQTEVAINHASCGKSLSAAWSVVLSGVPCSDLQFWVTRGDCSDTPASGDYKLTAVAQSTFVAQRSQSSTVAIAVSSLPGFGTADGGTACGTAGIDFSDRLCASISVASDLYGTCSTKNVIRATTAVTIHYDELGPAAPTITEVQNLDSAVALVVGVSSDTDSIQVQQLNAEGTDFFDVTNTSGSATKATVSNLTNGTTYTFRVVAYDLAGNASAPSETATGTPRASTGFWGLCRESGCAASQGGCSAAGGSVALAVLALTMLVRRTRR